MASQWLLSSAKSGGTQQHIATITRCLHSAVQDCCPCEGHHLSPNSMKFDWRCRLLVCMRHHCMFRPFSSATLRKPYRPRTNTKNLPAGRASTNCSPRQRAQHTATTLWQRTRLGSVIKDPSPHSTQKGGHHESKATTRKWSYEQTTMNTKNKSSTEYCPRQVAFIGEPPRSRSPSRPER